MTTPKLLQTAEGRRLLDMNAGAPWRRWGPYLSERQWGTVREDYSPDGEAWSYFPFEHALSRAYRWGEDGIAGFCDQSMRWCLGLALWNGEDPFLKERLFGLSNAEGNHGEDVKEVYHYLDAVPTHAYQRMVYRYPLSAFPYAELRRRNAERGRGETEFELEHTGVFEGGRFADVTVEYAKDTPDDILIVVSVSNASASPATVHVLPHLWARNSWSWAEGESRSRIVAQPSGDLIARRVKLKNRRLSHDSGADVLLCENETNLARLFGGSAEGPFKDGINDFVVNGDRAAVSRTGEGSKAAVHAVWTLKPFETRTLRLRFRIDGVSPEPFEGFDALMALRRAECDEFYQALQEDIADADAREVQRRALAGMLWSKQFYYFDVPAWLAGDPAQPKPSPQRATGRNAEWEHLNNADIISMPDKWEYPWYAAWDLGFHCVTLAMVDPEFAKDQLVLLTREWFMHPNGQLPAYEWNFGDVNPPVHAWAALRVFERDRALTGVADLAFLERILHKLLLNFTWWVNRKDEGGRNIFQGGFLGLDNISPFNRSLALPDGIRIDQADGTAWMAMYCLNLMRIAIELALHKPVYEDIATKFFEHFLGIANAMANACSGGMGLWNDEDGFFFDSLRSDLDPNPVPVRLRSLVGLIPILAVEVLDPTVFEKLPGFTRRLRWFLKYRPHLASLVARWDEGGMMERHLLSLLPEHRLKALLRRMLDECEFLSDFGVRSLSRAHKDMPYILAHGGLRIEVAYTPAESDSGLFGGNSNWRGPVWMPINYMLIDALRSFYSYFGPEFRVECPVGSGFERNLQEVADELARRLARLFLPDGRGERPSTKGVATVAGAPLFHEYFHGDTGLGLGASHQTGWTGLIANILEPPHRETGNA